MGYDVAIDSEDFEITPGHDGAVLRHVQAWSEKKVEEPAVVVAVRRAKTAAQAFAALGFEVAADRRGALHGIGWDGRAPDWFWDLDELWGGIDCHMKPGAKLQVTTEDDDEEDPEVIEFGESPPGEDDDEFEDKESELDFDDR